MNKKKISKAVTAAIDAFNNSDYIMEKAAEELENIISDIKEEMGLTDEEAEAIDNISLHTYATRTRKK